MAAAGSGNSSRHRACRARHARRDSACGTAAATGARPSCIAPRIAVTSPVTLGVVLGLLIDLWLLVRLSGGLTEYRVTGVRAAALYWYVVAGISVAVLVTQVSPS